MTRRNWGGGALLCLLTAGCMVGPDYHTPDAPLSAGFKELAGWQVATPADAADKGAWWSIYRDPVLDGLERQVNVSNQTVKEFEAQYRNAKALVDEARANLFPVLGVNAGVTRASGGGGGSSGSSSVSSSGFSSGSRNATTYTLEGSASWDLDVWGRIRRQVESNVAEAQASAADLANAQLSAQGSLATDYFQLRYQDSLKILLQQTVDEYQRSLAITRNQYNAGTAAQSDVAAAQALLESARSQLVAVEELRQQYEHAIAMLTGHAPSDLTIAPGTLTNVVPVTPPGLPSTLLQRRPDIAAAERTMQEQNALTGVAVAAYYPDISLSALYGYSGDPLRSLISVANRVWSLGAAASETLFDGGARSSAVRAARATYDQSVATYRQTVLTALQQVEDQLVALRVLEQQAVVQDRAVVAIQRAVQVFLNQYKAGTVAYTSVITEQQQELSDQQSALSIRENRMLASVGLVQALGGGWDASALPAAAGLHTNPLVP